ncbi:unnamed protein product [Arabidopsis halleri]
MCPLNPGRQCQISTGPTFIDAAVFGLIDDVAISHW